MAVIRDAEPATAEIVADLDPERVNSGAGFSHLDFDPSMFAAGGAIFERDTDPGVAFITND